MTRNRKKSGRGFTREEWIQHHKRIVEISEKRQKLIQEEKEKKQWGSKVESSIIMEQVGDGRTESILRGEETNTEETTIEMEEDSPKVQKVRKVTGQNGQGDGTIGKIGQSPGGGTGDTRTNSTNANEREVAETTRGVSTQIQVEEKSRFITNEKMVDRFKRQAQ